MPALELFPLAGLAARSVNQTRPPDAPFEVICAWPVSGQYGPGSRILYYVLVAICVLARRAEWLRNACLAAALLLPLVASLHGIVLATVHMDSAVDLDIYGAFQLCAIGVLVAPVAATLSRTYFKNPGRNAIVLWSLLVVAGLVSLSVEFYRVSNQQKDCWLDNQGRPLNSSLTFPYENANCSLICDTERGPHSKIRGGSADNIYVIPVPYVLTFNVGIMLTAALCIPAILLIAWMLVTSSHTNWTRRFGEQSSLALKVPVKLFDAESGMPPVEELRKHTRTLNKIGVIGTELYRPRRPSIACPSFGSADEETAEHHELAVHHRTPVDSGAASSKTTPAKAGMAGMLQRLHAESALSIYDFDVKGKSLQIREMKLAANVENFARQVYAALRDLENEDVDIICVESIEVEEGSPEAKVMKWLQNEEQADRDAASRKTRKQEAHSPGAVILLTLFGLAVLTILVVGEMNFFSRPVNYQTEPMANIGQWAPVCGTILVVIGSIYVLIAEGMRKERRKIRAEGDNVHDPNQGIIDEIVSTTLRKLIAFNDLFDAPRWLFDHSDFERAQQSFPTVPGEENRNLSLQRTREEYEPPRSSNDSIRSAATSRRSFTGSMSSRQRERSSTTPEPEPGPPLRKRTLTLPEVENAPRPRRSTTTSTPGTPLEPIVPHNTAEHPTIVFSPDEGIAPDDDVIR